MAIQILADQPKEMFWEMHREIDDQDRRTLAYLEAANRVLNLDLDFVYHKKRGQKNT